jgi:hypothetical protein
MSYSTHDVLSEFIHHLDLDGGMKVGHAPKEVEDWFEGLGLPMDMLRFLQWDWPQVDSQIGHIAVFSSQNIMKNKDTPRLLMHRFLPLGSAPNGDLFVIDISTGQCVPGFISHDAYWGYEDTVNPREIFQAIARSLESLLYKLIEFRYVPTDYYAAKEFNEFLKSEEQSGTQS